MAIKPLPVQIQRANPLLLTHLHHPSPQSNSNRLPLPTPILIPILDPAPLQNPHHPPQDFPRSPAILRVDGVPIPVPAREVLPRAAEPPSV